MIVENNQNIFDVALQEFGSLEETFKMLSDNNLTFNSKLQSGQELIINNAELGDNNVKNFVTLQKITYNNDQGLFVPPLVAGDFNSDFNQDFY